MPRFYFHLRDEKGVSPDTDGIDFESIGEAYLDAFRAATDLWRELLIARKDPRLYRFEIANASGEVLIVLPFTEVLDTARSARNRHSVPRIYQDIHATIRRNSAVTDSIASEIRLAMDRLDEARVLLRGFEASASKLSQTRASALSARETKGR